MRIKVADVTQKVSFVAVDATDGFARETGITAWTVYYSLNGGTATVMTTPTIAELSAANMAGAYVLTVDESGMVSAKGELTLHITATGVAPVTRVIEITDNFESDSYARLGAPAGASIAADLLVIDNFVDDLETRLTAARAGYMDNLSAGAVALASGVTVTTNNDKTGYSLTADVRIKKNTALANFMFVMVNGTDHFTPQTGLTVTATRSLDGATFAACANAVTELSNGVYIISLAAGDLNADVVTLRFTAAGADDRLITIVTQIE